MSLAISRDLRVLEVRLNRPEKRNALTAEMCAGIASAVENAQPDEDVGAILISAAGTVFCAGMDLDEAAEHDRDELATIHEKLFSTRLTSRKPILIAVNGAALGGGLGLVAQGHVVLSSERASYGLPEIRVGLWPFLVYRSVEAAMGGRRTLELSLSGRSFTAEQACTWGLVHYVCPEAELSDMAQSLAVALAKSSPTAIASGMRYASESTSLSWKESGTLAASLRKQVMESSDFREGVLAFKEHRDARWPSLPKLKD